jgi:hypothetical protein
MQLHHKAIMTPFCVSVKTKEREGRGLAIARLAGLAVAVRGRALNHKAIDYKIMTCAHSLTAHALYLYQGWMLLFYSPAAASRPSVSRSLLSLSLSLSSTMSLSALINLPSQSL